MFYDRERCATLENGVDSGVRNGAGVEQGEALTRVLAKLTDQWALSAARRLAIAADRRDSVGWGTPTDRVFHAQGRGWGCATRGGRDR